MTGMWLTCRGAERRVYTSGFGTVVAAILEFVAPRAVGSHDTGD